MFDVVVIGTGIMGAAVSRELSKYELNYLIKKMMFLVVQQKQILQ